MTSLISKIKNVLKRPMPLIVFSSIISIGTLVAYNIPFFQYVIDNSNESAIGLVWLVVSLVIIMLAANSS